MNYLEIFLIILKNRKTLGDYFHPGSSTLRSLFIEEAIEVWSSLESLLLSQIISPEGASEPIVLRHLPEPALP